MEQSLAVTGSHQDPPRSVYLRSELAQAQIRGAHANYLREKGKSAERIINLREVIDERNGIQLDLRDPHHALLAALVDLPIVQRMRSIGQVGTAAYVYKDATHPRFGHALGSAYLACQVLTTLRTTASFKVSKEIEKYAPAVIAATLLHDLGHVAPRSHLAEGMWFPAEKRTHERITRRIVEADGALRYELKNAIDRYPELPQIVNAILAESPDIPRWTWLLVSGGGWNLDRGDWVYRDSVHCGVSYGRYDVVPLTKRLVVTESGDLAVTKDGVSLIQNFFQARYNMYQFVYFHPACRVAVEMHNLLANRAREVLAAGGDLFADATMKQVLTHQSSDELPLESLLGMTEGWWEYHLERWTESADPILSDLASRLKVRQLFRHFPDDEYHRQLLGKLIDETGLPREYYLVALPPVQPNSQRDLERKALQVLVGRDADGQEILKPLSENSALLAAYADADKVASHSLLAIPFEPFHSHPILQQ